MPLYVKELYKSYGSTVAVRGISFTAEEGKVFGLLGPNGAGKTTTLKIISTVLRPDSGSVFLNSIDIINMAESAREFLTYVPEDAGTYRNLTGYEHLEFAATVYARNKDEYKAFLEEGIRIADLGDKIYEKTKSYSKGMKRRLQIARALMVKPKLAVLDEPTAGIDVFHAISIRNLIKDFAKKNSSIVIVSSHNMFEVEKLCDEIGIINEGVLLRVGSIKEIKGDNPDLEEVFMKLAKEDKIDKNIGEPRK
ncbi:MAG: ABC transporter ATP-binding protein [Nitrososphaeria archaeon]